MLYLPFGHIRSAAPATSSIHLRMPPEVKARFLAEAERVGMGVADWLIEAGELARAGATRQVQFARSATRDALVAHHVPVSVVEPGSATGPLATREDVKLIAIVPPPWWLV